MNSIILTYLVIIWGVKVNCHVNFVDLKGDNFFKSNIVKRDVVSDVLKVKEFIVKTSVANRFAKTTVSSKIENNDTLTKQAIFSVVFPKSAFISDFYMEIDGKKHKAFVIDKSERKYEKASATTPYVAIGTRNSKRFTVNVTLESQKEIDFYLTYEEILQRKKGKYQIVTNIQPGQIVKKLLVEVNIKETTRLLFVNTLPLRSGGNTLLQNDAQLNPQAKIEISNTSAVVKFYPDVKRQLQFACAGLGNEKYEGFAGQFVIEYDMERVGQGSETLFQDKFFVNFFAPSNLKYIPKHVVFTLDTSGSMSGQPITQWKEAMRTLLSQLYAEDLFSIVEFTHDVYIWDLNLNRYDVLPLKPKYGSLESQLQLTNIPKAFVATLENIEKAKRIINSFEPDGGTNTMGGLEVGLYLVKLVQEQYPEKYQPIIIFSTDGMPFDGIETTSEIISLISNINSKDYNTPIYPLSIGNAVDWNFLQELSSPSKAEPIFIDEDDLKNGRAFVQLKSFYETISTPVLSNITFNNLPATTHSTRRHFPIFYDGSEIAVAGIGVFANATSPISISAKGEQGLMNFEAKMGKPLTAVERMWAYLTIRQLIDGYHSGPSEDNKTDFRNSALDLAMNYSFVVEDATEMVVVKPDDTKTVIDIMDASYGTILESTNDMPICENITNWIITNFRTPEPATTETATEMTEVMTTTDTAATTQVASTVTTSTVAATSATAAATTIFETATSATAAATTIFEAATISIDTAATTDAATTIDATPVTSTSLPSTTAAEPIIAKKTQHPIILPIIVETTTLKIPRIMSNTELIPLKQQTLTTCKDTPFGCCRDGVTPAKGHNFSGCVKPSRSSEICSLPKDDGTCSKRFMNRIILKWAYDNDRGGCHVFWYRGCGGNDNRFDTKKECEEICVNPFGPDRCKLPIFLGGIQGRCQSPVENWFHDKGKGECVKRWYSGCAGNSNRFSTKEECLDLCVQEDVCLLPFEEGDCDASISRYAFDPHSKRCKKIVYTGCGGNRNNFNSIRECKKTCVGRCELPKQIGVCRGQLQRWYYNKRQKICLPFLYGGCSGNTNNFFSLTDCNTVCKE